MCRGGRRIDRQGHLEHDRIHLGRAAVLHDQGVEQPPRLSLLDLGGVNNCGPHFGYLQRVHTPSPNADHERLARVAPTAGFERWPSYHLPLDHGHSLTMPGLLVWTLRGSTNGSGPSGSTGRVPLQLRHAEAATFGSTALR